MAKRAVLAGLLLSRTQVNYYHSDKRRLVIIENTNKNTPIQLVNAAIEHQKHNPSGDVYWVVFDRESTINITNNIHKQAFNEAKKHGISIAFSNVCFEYWLLLHFIYTDASYHSYDDLMARSEFKSVLANRGLKNYDKGNALLFDTLQQDNGIAKAKDHAERRKRHALATAEKGKEAPYYLNPYTDVHELLNDIDNFSANKPSCRSANTPFKKNKN